MVFAPALMVASNTRHRKSTSERTASSAENSTSSVYSRASFTARTAASSTASGSMRSLCFMWMGLVAMKVWMRPELAPLIASPARFTSLSLARASEHTVESRTVAATARMASKSPGLEAAKPASITSTRSRSSCLPIRTFSSLVMAAPGLCSPSRIVVSKMMTWFFTELSVLRNSDGSIRPALPGGRMLHYERDGVFSARGAAAAGPTARARGGRREGRYGRCWDSCCQYSLDYRDLANAPSGLARGQVPARLAAVAQQQRGDVVGA